jgi:hypothetical protein
MGYSHYFKFNKQPSAKKFKAFSEDCKKIAADCESNGIIVRGGTGEGAPIINETTVSINGDSARGQDHETFFVDTSTNGFNFCKTAEKEYDPAVTAMLVALKKHFPKTEISGDGGQEGFEEGMAICQKLFGYGADFKED